jgi:hypothetical protein
MIRQDAEAMADPSVGWVLAWANGLSLVGKINTSRLGDRHLQPVYAFSIQPIEVRPGHMAIHYGASPVGMLASFDSIDLGEGATIKPLSELGEADRRMLMGAVKQGEEMVLQLRASQAGIALAAPGSKLPPPPLSSLAAR